MDNLVASVKTYLPFTEDVPDQYLQLSFLVGLFAILLLRPRGSNNVSTYENLYPQARTDIGANTHHSKINERQKEYKTLVDTFYDLVTDFYEYGWSRR